MKYLPVFALAAVLLTGCASTTPATQPANDYTAPPDASPTPGQTAQVEPSGPGKYLLGFGDTQVTLDVPAPAGPDAESVAVLESLSVKPAAWIKVTVDNRKGSEYAPVAVVGLTTAEGKRVEYRTLRTIADEASAATPELPSDVQRRYALWTAQTKEGAKPGEVVETWVAAMEPEPVFVRVDATQSSIETPVKASKQ